MKRGKGRDMAAEYAAGGGRLGDPDDCKTCHLIAEWRAKL